MGTTRRNKKDSHIELDDEIVENYGMSMDDESDKQEKRSRKRGASSKGRELKWRNVTAAADSLLVGSSEGGFLSLEEIDGDSWLQISGLEELPSTAAASTSSSDRKKRKKRLGAEKPTGVANPSETASLSTLKRKKQKRDAAPATNLEGDKILPSTDGEEIIERKILPSTPGEEKTKRKKKKTKKKKKPKPGLSATPLDLSISVDVSSALADGGEKASEQQESFWKDKKNAKENKPKLGSRARRLLRGKTSTESTELKVVRSTEPVEVPADVVDEEPIDMSAWAEMRLHSLLEKALCELKFREPTPIQRQCIPAAAHKGKDVIGAAETGSGKTLAFGLPILQRLLEEQEKESSKHMISEDAEENVEETSTTRRSDGPLRALIITPTRELALQVCEHLKVAAKWTGIRVVPIVGGMATQKQQRILKQKPEIVVGTPGRLWELMSGGDNHLMELHWLSFFVLDEADRMVEKGHFEELQSIIDMLPATRGRNFGKESGNVDLTGEGIAESEVGSPLMPQKRRQTLVFSATLALPAEFKSKLKRGHMLSKAASKSIDSVAVLSARAGVSHEAAIVDLTSSTVVAEKLTESILECRDEEKDDYLYYILKVHAGGRVIVFCTSIAALRRVSAILKALQIPVIPLHAQMQQRARLKAMDRFRKDRDCVLVATDVAARGLDVPGIRTVVHYQLPHSAEIYVHRSGRTARGSSGGISIALVSPSDQSKYLTLCRALSKPDGLQTFPVNMTYLPAIQKRVSLAGKVDKLMQKQSASKATEAWLARNAEAMDIDMEVSEDEDNGSNNRGSSKDKGSTQLRGLQKELQWMLSQPLKPKAFSNRYVTGGGMTSLVTKQLQDYMLAKTGLGGLAGSGKQLVIGQEQLDPLEALQLAATTPDVERNRY